MRVTVGPGTYVVAVSGGVDSMVLLDLLRKRPGLKLIVAHFDHGIRPDSDQDRKLVQQAAKNYGLNFVHTAAKLGAQASEAEAREARYKFLHEVKAASNAQAIITAHHQDDVVETAIMNLMRGTGRRGLTSLRTTDGIVRPLLEYDKRHIYEYAQTHKIAWREDETNTDTTYTRNYVRVHLVPKLSASQRAQLVILLNELRELNDHIDTHMVNMLHLQPSTNSFKRSWFIALPHSVAGEFMHTWLRHRGASELNRKQIERLITDIKTVAPNKKLDIDKNLELVVGKQHVTLQKRKAKKATKPAKKSKH